MEKKTSKKKKKRRVKYSSRKIFTGSKPASFYGKDYFLAAKGSNYGRKTHDGQVLFTPYEEQFYLPRNREVAQWIMRRFHPKTAIVLGCARGYMVKALRDLGINAVGVDISRWAITHSPDDVQDYMYVGDVCDLSLWMTQQFDVAVAFDVLEHIHVPDLYTAIDEVARVAKTVLLDVPIANDDLHPDHSGGTDHSHVSVYTTDWWKRQFMERGFIVANTRVYTYPEGDQGATITFKQPIHDEALPPLVIATNSKQFKILVVSNAPFVPSGYGVQTAGMAFRWNKYYDVRAISNYGLQGRALTLNGLTIYPLLHGDTVGYHTARIVNGYWKPDVVITLFDIWMGGFNTPTPIHPRWIPIVPVDHDPVQEPTLQNAMQAYRLVAMSQFGYNQLQQAGLEAVYIPHGIDVNVFKPSEDKMQDRHWLNDHSVPINPKRDVEIPDNAFLIGVNAANKDPQRKSFERMMLGLQLFLNNNPDAKKDTRMYIHSWRHGGRDLQRDARILKVEPYLKMAFTYDMLCGFNDEHMRTMYGAFSVLANCSQAEGFGIPILEACACGVPPIVTKCTAMTELTDGHGWLVPEVTRYFTALSSLWAIPNEVEIAKAFEDAYNHPDKVADFGNKARAFSLQYDWDTKIIPQWLRLFEDIRMESASFGISDAKNTAYLEKVKEVLG